MKILFIAPQPFYEERGTPIAVRWALETLANAGHQIDLLTYHCGQDIALPGLTIYRASTPKNLPTVPIGFSFAKIRCDLRLFSRLRQLLSINHYDVIHAVEESVFLVLPILPFLKKAGTRLVYDLDSCLSDQIIEKYPRFSWLRHALAWFEAKAVRRADLLLPVCPYLAQKAKEWGAHCPITILYDRAITANSTTQPDNIRAFCQPGQLLALYVGNLEHYQGIDLLLEAFARLDPAMPLILVLIGGKPADLTKYKEFATKLGIEKKVHFLGPRPLQDLQSYLEQADILLSPRLKGNNTPLKIYSYMLAGKAILATAINSHTQVLSNQTAVLVPPNPAAMAEALREQLIRDAKHRETLGAAARHQAEEHHTPAAYEKTLLSAYTALASGGLTLGSGGAIRR